MDWITQQIAIGTRLEALDPELLNRSGFRSVLSLDGTVWEKPVGDPGLDELHSIPLLDGYGNDPGQFRLAIECLSRLVHSHAPVLVHCNLGRNRSPAVVAGYLMQSKGIGAVEAIACVAAKRNILLRAPLEDLVFALSSKSSQRR